MALLYQPGLFGQDFHHKNHWDYKITENKELGKQPAILTTHLINDANMKS